MTGDGRWKARVNAQRMLELELTSSREGLGKTKKIVHHAFHTEEFKEIGLYLLLETGGGDGLRAATACASRACI